MLQRNQIRQKTPPSKANVSAALAQDWTGVSARVGKSTLADTIDADVKTVNRAITGENVPELHKAMASLLADPHALDRVTALYGFRMVPMTVEAANDMTTIASLSSLVSQFCAALEDGIRDHRETCQLADSIRPLMLALSAIVEQADKIRSVA